jgi:hypothetical protein
MKVEIREDVIEDIKVIIDTYNNAHEEMECDEIQGIASDCIDFLSAIIKYGPEWE